MLMLAQQDSISKKGKGSNVSGESLEPGMIDSKVYDSPNLAENEATFAIGPQGIMNADG